MDASKSDNALSYLRKETLDIFNRLHSIEEDIAFVQQVHKAYPDTPLLPNLRCGSWYTDPEIAVNTPAYFKSTDGHFNNWSFNLRRSNLHLLSLIVERQGMIVIDSTRSGKRIPDALSKTVPIWCSVINRALLIRHPQAIKREDGSIWDTALYTPPSTVSIQEHSQIEKRLDNWAELLAASSFSLPILPSPLRPIWITPATTTFPTLPTNQQSFLPIICVSASKQIEQGVERRSSGFSYIQGSGDDHELWSMGLTPDMFWTYHNELLRADRMHLANTVSKIVSRGQPSSGPIKRKLTCPTPVIRVGGLLLLCTITDVPDSRDHQEQNAYIILTPSMDQESTCSTRSKLYIPVISGKKGQTEFRRSVLPKSMAFIREQLFQGRNVCVACNSGQDLSVGVVLAALQLYFTDAGILDSLSQGSDGISLTTLVDKKSIRTRLEWIIASRPQANPSRATLKRVNEFILTSPALQPTIPSPTV